MKFSVINNLIRSTGFVLFVVISVACSTQERTSTGEFDVEKQKPRASSKLCIGTPQKVGEINVISSILDDDGIRNLTVKYTNGTDGVFANCAVLDDPQVLTVHSGKTLVFEPTFGFDTVSLQARCNSYGNTQVVCYIFCQNESFTPTDTFPFPQYNPILTPVIGASEMQCS